MLYDNPNLCICGNPPELKRRALVAGMDNPYYYYDCEDCGIQTFSTREEEFCRELWNAAIEVRNKKRLDNKE